MNYLLLTEYFPESEQAELTGGVESRCFHIVKELAKNKDNSITVLCSYQPGQQRISYVFGVKIIRCGPTMPYSSNGNIIKRFLFSYTLYSNGKKLTNINAVEGASFITYPPAYFIGRKVKAKKIATWHETWVGEWIKNKGWLTGIFGEVWERLSLKLKWDKIIAVSEFTKNKLIETGIPKDKIKVIPNGLNLDYLSEIKAKKEKIPTVCYFGRLNWQKNLGVLIKAIAEVKKEMPNIQCKIIGSGPALEELKKIALQLKLEKEVHFFSQVKNYGQLLTEAKMSHIFVHPSTLEGFGITVIEAMALELPYIISDIKPFIEITHNGKGGEIFPQNNSEELAKKIILLFKNKKMYLSKVQEEKILVQEYDWKNILETNNYLSN